MVDQNVDRAFSGELGGSDGERIGPTSETVGDEQGIGVSSRRDRTRAEEGDTDGNARTLRERNGGDWPSGSQSLGFPRLTIQAMEESPAGCIRSCRSTRKPFQHGQRARGAKVTRGRRMASLHGPGRMSRGT